MNRPKFRVWDIEEQKWYKPIFKAYKKELHDIQIELNGDLSIRTFDKEGKFVTIHESMFRGRYELLQSTGLFDKNGKEIYEGDILHHKVQGTGVVFYPYRDTMASFGIRNVNTNFGTNLQDTAKAGYEVIGNKFEHPHLLGED
ncbi:YopX family protein [Mammaliicoccus sciuri]|uniref:YopX family protein n=1 Tax=Mammaliicoccus sciuri TaxID=1296 RepID=UPI003F56A199